MDTVLHGLLGNEVFCYIDDIMICTSTKERHLELLREGHRGNPPAMISTSMTAYGLHSAQKGYSENVAMCFLGAIKGDFLYIQFNPLVNVTGLMFLSGVAPAPNGKLGPETIVYGYDTENREIRLGSFSKEGDFVMRMNGTLLSSLHILVTRAIRQWIAIDHIFIEKAPS
ncbi:hypothetical protein Aduo_015149 [Ancylostoma duodenale]